MARLHMTALDHWIWPHECETCQTRFRTSHQAAQHMRDKDHWRYDYDCETCDYAFRTASARDRHQAETNHYEDRHCKSCDRYFQNANNLNQHLKSNVHQGATVPCPFCGTTFTTASGVSHHLETSSCPKARNMNTQTIHRSIRELDQNGVITENLLTHPDYGLDQSETCGYVKFAAVQKHANAMFTGQRQKLIAF
ncbi:hypothetical protein CAC42_7848 [Sphaceloma murrayae]|uniref:C2H2-type domain-containing protein n=1 Tax=Sphaceloma murrayae TaxID=2082308 RepID=A0A2K1QXV5_9PEZI|nr:hypothetical protein CAC42_7848 [Sphaceloma murrayae]